MEDVVTRGEHNEFVRRIEEEEARQNHRISILEQSLREITDLTLTVKELAVNMKHMATEQEKQGKRLEAIEERDGIKWRKAVSYIVTAIGGAIIAYLLGKVGLGG